jgi:uncharacterized protein YjcR
MSANHEKAEKDYIKGMKYKEIAEKYEVSINTVKSWKQRYEWSKDKGAHSEKGMHTKSKRVHTKKGGQPGNKNALGNSGGAGGPPRNDKAVKHGLFRQFLPDDEETRAIYDSVGQTNPLDILWENIQIKFTSIVRAQKVMFVESKEEMIKELKKRKYQVENTGTKENPVFEQFLTEEEYEFQFAWDRQATFLNAQARAMSTLTSMIRQYEEMCRLGWADEEQQLKLDKLKAEIESIKGAGKGQEADDWTKAVQEAADRRRAMVNNDEQ